MVTLSSSIKIKFLFHLKNKIVRFDYKITEIFLVDEFLETMLIIFLSIKSCFKNDEIRVSKDLHLPLKISVYPLDVRVEII